MQKKNFIDLNKLYKDGGNILHELFERGGDRRRQVWRGGDKFGEKQVKSWFKGNDQSECLETLLGEDVLDNQRVVNKKDDNGNTALLLAAMTGDKDSIIVLLRKGASLFKANNRGKTPLEYIPPETIEEFLNKCIEVSMVARWL